MSSISTNIIPKASYRTRRRKYDGMCWLIADNQYYELDDITDAVWLACDGTATIAQIAYHLTATQQISLGRALTATLVILEYFRSIDLVDYSTSQ